MLLCLRMNCLIVLAYFDAFCLLCCGLQDECCQSKTLMTLAAKEWGSKGILWNLLNVSKCARVNFVNWGNGIFTNSPCPHLFQVPTEPRWWVLVGSIINMLHLGRETRFSAQVEMQSVEQLVVYMGVAAAWCRMHACCALQVSSSQGGWFSWLSNTSYEWSLDFTV